MSLGKRNRDSNETLIFLQDVGSKKAVDFEGKDGIPYFQVTKKVEGKWEAVAKVDRFSGKIRGVTVGLRYDPANEKHKENLEKYGNSFVIKIEVDDEEAKETYVWKAGVNMATRGLFNRLLTLTEFDNLEISLWKNDKGYDTYSLRQNGEIVKWKYNKEDVPEPVKSIFKGKPLSDYTAVDEFFATKIKEHFAALTAANKSAKATAPAPEPESDSEGGDEKDDAPPF